ncbi:sodium:calcium antiporter [Archaeoglobus veneficus]|uniref:Sodium/calcium exchanger membrane region n=1 Tax=Archaeoglobus veneficus (strain DSM 11195 / SNP6) TaxID=693661 RepID=F2KMJ2_ARCVS|nr:sodium:calcium antiporter [Archaeoglobus veneficus]AEA47189.1 sodium/calcium exchanger membrane region [Archaeoglobus veneficus SNP6]
MHALAELFFGMVVVFVAAFLFVNAIEYLGCRLRLGGSFVGATLAPLFTSLPELTVFLVAVFSGVESGEEIGIGTIFGQPFMASSLSYGLVGIAAFIGYYLGRRDNATLEIDRSLILPYVFITILFPLTLVPAFLPSTRHLFGIFFLGTFVFYMWVMYARRKAGSIEDAEIPYFCKVVPHPFASGIIQLVAAVFLLYYGSESLVSAVDTIARGAGISPMGLALIIIPATTAIPETASALIWGYRGRDTLSLGSLVGEKILYSTFYPGIGLLITSWTLDIHVYLSVLTTTLVSFILLYFISKERVPWYWLCTGLFFFVGYAVLVFMFHI